MKIILDSKSAQPLNEQIRAQIIRQIADGTLKADECLPSVRNAARMLGVGVITVKAAYDKSEFSPAKAIENLNNKFASLNLDERNYVTVAVVRIDGDSITYSMAGHNVPILLKTGTGITRIMLNSPPVSNWFENPSYYEDVIPYKKGDILVLLTDGVTECKNARGEMFGADGAIKTLSVSRTAEEFIKNLESKLRNFKSSFDDDITAIAFDL